MKLTEIWKGMPTGAEDINDNFSRLSNVRYTSINGATMLNGAQATSGGISGALMEFPNNMALLHLRGYVEKIKADAFKSVDIVQLPGNYMSGYNIKDFQDIYAFSKNGVWIKCQPSSGNNFKITPQGNLNSTDGLIFETVVYMSKGED